MRRLPDKETIDASGCVVMPGLVNSHTHLPMVCFRGMADDLPLMEWLNKHIFPAEHASSIKKWLRRSDTCHGRNDSFRHDNFFATAISLKTLSQKLSAPPECALLSRRVFLILSRRKSQVFEKNDADSQAFCDTLAATCADDYTGIFLSFSLYLFSDNTCPRKGSRPRSRHIYLMHCSKIKMRSILSYIVTAKTCAASA